MTKVKSIESYRIPGVYDPIEYTVEDQVCDECGSSDISNYPANIHVSTSINGAFSLVIIVSFLGAVVVALITRNAKICGGIGMISVVTFFIYMGVVSYIERNNNKHLKCNKCGNEHIT